MSSNKSLKFIEASNGAQVGINQHMSIVGNNNTDNRMGVAFRDGVVHVNGRVYEGVKYFTQINNRVFINGKEIKEPGKPSGDVMEKEYTSDKTEFSCVFNKVTIKSGEEHTCKIVAKGYDLGEEFDERGTYENLEATIETNFDVGLLSFSGVEDLVAKGAKIGAIAIGNASGKVSFIDCTLGRITISTTSGDVYFSGGEVVGLFKAKTMSGDIEVIDSDLAALSFTTMSGDVYVAHCNLNDDFTANTMSGNIDDIQNKSLAGKVFKTMSGNLRGYGEKKGVFSTMSGKDKFKVKNG